MFEHMVTMIIMAILIFCFSSIVLAQQQVLAARKVHLAAIELMQASYYTVDLDELNASLQREHPSWYFQLEEMAAVATRRDYLLTLHYQISLPLFNIHTAVTMEGFVR